MVVVSNEMMERRLERHIRQADTLETSSVTPSQRQTRVRNDTDTFSTMMTTNDDGQVHEKVR